MNSNNSKIVIRLAKKDDAGIIALLGRITFAETFGHLFIDKQDLLNYLTSTFSVSKIDSSLSKPNNVYWIAFVDSLAVGYAKLKLNSPSEFIAEEKLCQLQKIYVLKDFLSAKIGFQLQNQLLNKAKEKGCRKIWLSVLHDNNRAITFYLKNGFQIIGEHDFQIGKQNFDFIAMAKQLQSS